MEPPSSLPNSDGGMAWVRAETVHHDLAWGGSNIAVFNPPTSHPAVWTELDAKCPSIRKSPRHENFCQWNNRWAILAKYICLCSTGWLKHRWQSIQIHVFFTFSFLAWLLFDDFSQSSPGFWLTSHPFWICALRLCPPFCCSHLFPSQACSLLDFVWQSETWHFLILHH